MVPRLEKLISIMDPTKVQGVDLADLGEDWGQDMVSEEDRRSVQVEAERC